MFSHNIVADSKAKGLVDYIISKGHVTLPELMSLRINGERLASVSTYISDGRSYARKKGYEIVNSSIRGKRFNSLYYAQEIGNEKTRNSIRTAKALNCSICKWEVGSVFIF